MSLMTSSTDTVNLKKKKAVEGSLFAFFHLYYFLLKFTPNPLAEEILVSSSVVLAGFILLWLSPCYRAGEGGLPPSHRKGARGHVLHGVKTQDTEENMKLGCSADPLCWAEAERGKCDRAAFSLGSTESCQGIHVPRECQADGLVSLRQAQLLLPSSSAEISFLRTSQINPTSLCFT